MRVKVKRFIDHYILPHKAYRFFISDWAHLTDLQTASDMMATMRFSRNLIPECSNGPNAKRILVIAPHPDDEILGPGGTLIKAIDRGAEVLALYLTAGSSDAITAQLKSEATQIAEQLNYKTLFLNYRPKSIPIDETIVSKIVEIINQFKPDALFLPFCLDDHDDHRRASHLLLLARETKKIHGHFDVWAYQVYTSLIPNVVVDITAVADRKANAINHYQSQIKKRNWAHYILGLNAYNQRFLPNGPESKYAEAFFVLPLDEYLNYCRQYFGSDPTKCYYTPEYKKITEVV